MHRATASQLATEYKTELLGGASIAHTQAYNGRHGCTKIGPSKTMPFAPFNLTV